MAGRFGTIGEQFFDNKGDPLVNGFLRFEISGGGDNIETFADPDFKKLNANPVPLSPAGRQPNIFFSGVARATLLDSEEGQIEVRDPVESGSGASGNPFSPWNALSVYEANALVSGADDRYYLSIASGNLNNDPISTTGFWQETRFINVWNVLYQYELGLIVFASDDNLYVSLISSNLGNDPIIDAGDNWRSIGLPALTTSVDEGVITFDGTDGRSIRSTSMTIDDSGNASILSDLSVGSLNAGDLLLGGGVGGPLTGLDLSTKGSIVVGDGTSPISVAVGSDVQVLTADSGETSGVKWGNPTSRTIVAQIATTSGNEFDFTGIPSGVTEVVLFMNNCSFDISTDVWVMLLGDSGGFETTGYGSNITEIFPALSTNGSASNFLLSRDKLIGEVTRGTAVLRRSHNTLHEWHVTVMNSSSIIGVGKKTLSGELTQVRFTSSSGSSADAGSVGLSFA